MGTPKPLKSTTGDVLSGSFSLDLKFICHQNLISHEAVVFYVLGHKSAWRHNHLPLSSLLGRQNSPVTELFRNILRTASYGITVEPFEVRMFHIFSNKPGV